eukprot:450864_1
MDFNPESTSRCNAMRANKWQSQYIKRKFNNKHKNIAFTHTRKRNKKTTRRKARHYNQRLCKEYTIYEYNVLNIKSHKGFKTQYSNKKTTKLHSKSPQTNYKQTVPYISNYSTMEYYHYPSKKWLPFSKYSWSYKSYRVNNCTHQNYCQYQIEFKNNYYKPNIGTCYMDILLVNHKHKDIAIQQVIYDKYFNKYYIKQYKTLVYIVICYWSKYRQLPKRKRYKTSSTNTQYMYSLQDEFSLIDFNKNIFKNISINVLKNYIDNILETQHNKITDAICTYDKKYSDNQKQIQIKLATNRQHDIVSKKVSNPNTIDSECSIIESKNKVKIVVTLFLDCMEATCYTDLYDIRIKTRNFKLKFAMIKANWIGTNIIDLYKIKPAKLSLGYIPISTVTDIEMLNNDYYYSCHQKIKRLINEPPILEV